MENQKKEKTTEASLEKQQKKLKNRKKLKYGGLATAITVIFVAVVVLVNVVVTQLDKRFPNAKLDLTTANLYEISDETLDYIRNLDKDVDVAISSDEATFTSDKYNKMIAETLSKYQGYSDRINVTYFDTTKESGCAVQVPGTVRRFDPVRTGHHQQRQAYQGVQHPDRYV